MSTSDKLAKVIDVMGHTNVNGILNSAGLNWTPTLVDTTKAPYQSKNRSIVRPDTNQVLADVGKNFRVNDHRAHLNELQPLISEGTILPVSVSIWDDGGILAFQFRAPELDVTILGKDVVSPLLTLAFSYGSKLADTAFFSDFRWFCKNQMGQVAKLTTDFRVKHRGAVSARYADLLSGRIHELSGELSGRYQTMRRMLSTPLTGRQVPEYIGEVIGASKQEIDISIVSDPDELTGNSAKITDVIDAYLEDDAGAPGTVWQAYNGVTRYMTHKQGRSEATRQRNMLLGTGGKVAGHAWEVAARLAA